MEAALDANKEASRENCDWSTFHVVLATSVQRDVHAGSTTLVQHRMKNEHAASTAVPANCAVLQVQ